MVVEDDGYTHNNLPHEEEKADGGGGLQAEDKGGKGGDKEDKHVVGSVDGE